MPQVAPPTGTFDLVACVETPVNDRCDAPMDAVFEIRLSANGEVYRTLEAETDGRVVVEDFPIVVPTLIVTVAATGYRPVVTLMLLAGLMSPGHNFFVLFPAKLRVSDFPLNKLAARTATKGNK